MRKREWGKKILSVMLASAIIMTNLMPVATLAAQENATDNVTRVEYNKNIIFYSDDYFRYPSTKYNPHLATASVIMTDNTWPDGNPKSANDTTWYQNQPEKIKGYFDAIGFSNFEANEDYRKRTEFDTIGLAAASRKIDDFTVIAVTVRSGSYFHEWANNVWLGTGDNSDSMHEGWYNAANKLIKFLERYAGKYRITGKVKLWMAGFSRGGATTNIAAGLLDNDISEGEKIFSNGAELAHDDLYAYTFESPQGANYGMKEHKKPGDPIYNNIWNIVNPNDLVTKVAMSEFGFTRFGTDKYITTKFYDTENFENNRKTFEALLKRNGNFSNYHGDSLTMYGIPGSKQTSVITNLVRLIYGDVGALGSAVGEYAVDGIFEAIDKSNWVVKDDKKVNYDSNIVTTIVLEEIVRSIQTRKNYTEKYQEHLKKLLYEFMDDVEGSAKSTEHELIAAAVTSLAVGAITDSLTIGGFGPNDIANLWATISSNPAVKDLKDSIGPLLSLGKDIYSERPNELVTLAKYSKNIFENHEFAVNIAHLEAQDDYYIDDYNSNLKSKSGLGDYDYIHEVRLRDSADFGRLSFYNFNDVKVWENDGKGKNKVIQIDGSSYSKSNISKCSVGYAAGYYNYFASERVEVFTSLDHNYYVEMQKFSWNPSYDTNFFGNIYYLGSNKEGNYIKNVTRYFGSGHGDSKLEKKDANFGSSYSRQSGSAFGVGDITIIYAAGIVSVGLVVSSVIYAKNKRSKEKN